MKAQFKSSQAAHVNNVAAQSSVQQLQQTTAQPTIQSSTNFSKRETDLQNEVKTLKQELQIKNNQLASVQNNHKNILDLFNKTSEEVASLKSQNKELQEVIEQKKEEVKVLNRMLNHLSEHHHETEREHTEQIQSLEKSLSEKNGQIKGLQESLELLASSKNNFAYSSISSLNLNEDEEVQKATDTPNITPNQINLDKIHTVESIVLYDESNNASQANISQGQPILGGAQAQLMGDSSQDFSIIDHQD